MLLWLLVNVLLPFLPLGLVLLLSRLLGWGKGIVDMIADGQLYFFSVALCGVFLYDALRAGELQPGFFLALFIAIIFLVVFYSASMVMTHSNSIAGTGADRTALASQRQKLARISIGATLVVVVLILYARWSLGMLG